MNNHEKMKQEAMKPFAQILLVLGFLSAVVTMVAVFLPLFESRIFGQVVSEERGIEYLIALFTGNNADLAIDNKGGTIIAFLVFCMLIMPIFFSLIIPYHMGYKHISRLHRAMYGKTNRIKMIESSFYCAVCSEIILCGVYYLNCLYHILEYFSWDFEVVFSDSAMITTKAHWPFIIQMIIFLAVFIVNKIMITQYRSMGGGEQCVPEKSVAEESVSANTMQESQNTISDGYQVVMLSWKQSVSNVARYPIVVKKIVGWDLSDAVEATVNTPTVIISGVTYEEAQQIKAKLEKVGCEIEIKQQE